MKRMRKKGCITGKNSIFAVLLIVVLMLSGCGSASKGAAYDSATTESVQSADMEFGMYDNGAMMEEDVMVEESAAEVTEGTGEAGNQAEIVQESNRKLIKRQYMTVETLEFDTFTDRVKEKVESVGGYIEQSSISGNSYYSSGRRYADYTIRIPVAQLESFVEGISQNCNVTEFSEEVDDITLKYVDTASRIEALKIEQENLMKMLTEEGDLDTILRIQSRLTEVRYELQSYESQMRVFDNNIDYSTVYLNVHEVERTTSKDEGGFGIRLKERLSDNLFDVTESLVNFALFLLGGIPYWILLAVIVSVVVFVVKHTRKRRTAKRTMKEMPMDTVSTEKAFTGKKPNASGKDGKFFRKKSDETSNDKE